MGKAMGFVLPFVKVPANIIRQNIESVPGGALLTEQGRAALKAGGRESAEAMGRMAVGSTALGLLAYWASQGLVSGNGPQDPDARAALMKTGWKPRSIKIGDTWVDYTAVLPTFAIPTAAVATAWEEYQDEDGADVDADTAANILLSIPQTILDQSFLSGLSDLNAAINDPGRYAKNYLGRLATGFVPFSGLQRNIAQTIDPVVRDASSDTTLGSVGTNIRAIVPGASTTLPAKLDAFGGQVTRNRVEGFSPISLTGPTTDPLVRELARLGMAESIPALPKNLPETKSTPARPFTPEERQRIGAAEREAVADLIKQRQWSQLDQRAARDLVRSAITRARARVVQHIRRAP